MAAKDERAFLRFIVSGSKRQVKTILKNITPRQLEALGEISINLLYGDRFERQVLDSLSRYRRIIRQLADKRLVAKRRKKVAQDKFVAVQAIVKAVEDYLP